MISIMDALSLGLIQMGFLGLIQLFLSSCMATILSLKLAFQPDADVVQVAILSLSLCAELGGLVTSTCVILKSIALFSIRAQLGQSRRQIRTLAFRASDTEERLAGQSALLTLVGILGIVSFFVSILSRPYNIVFACIFTAIILVPLAFVFTYEDVPGTLGKTIMILNMQRDEHMQAYAHHVSRIVKP